MTVVTAPWTPEQVAALQAWQQRGDVHEFTCGRWDSQHSVLDRLVPTAQGWVCSAPGCTYTQNWAHDFMFVPPVNLRPKYYELLEEAHAASRAAENYDVRSEVPASAAEFQRLQELSRQAQLELVQYVLANGHLLALQLREKNGG